MIIKELCVVQRKYTTNDGQDKTVWLKVGEIHQGQKGEYMVLFPHINLAALPRKEGEDRIFVSMFDPKPREGSKPARNEKPAKNDNLPDDLPF